MQADMHMHQLSRLHFSREQLSADCWHKPFGPAFHFLPQLACVVSKTAQRPEDEWTVADVQVPEQIGGQRESVKTHSVVSVGKLCKASCDDRRGRICGERVESVRDS